jgi:hypothetical protein
MKKLTILLLFLAIPLLAQEKRIGLGSDNENIYGTWQSWDGSSVLYMNYGEDGDTFLRQSDTPDGKEIAQGKFTLEEKHIYVQKENDEYRLLFYLKGMQLVVHKPDSAIGPGQAWLFRKVSDYGMSY